MIEARRSSVPSNLRQATGEAKGGTAEGLLGFLPEGCPGSAEKICRTAIVKTMERYHGTTKGAGVPSLCLFAMDLLRVHGFFNK